jgi:hypothetical protein
LIVVDGGLLSNFDSWVWWGGGGLGILFGLNSISLLLLFNSIGLELFLDNGGSLRIGDMNILGFLGLFNNLNGSFLGCGDLLLMLLYLSLKLFEIFVILLSFDDSLFLLNSLLLLLDGGNSNLDLGLFEFLLVRWEWVLLNNLLVMLNILGSFLGGGLLRKISDILFEVSGFLILGELWLDGLFLLHLLKLILILLELWISLNRSFNGWLFEGLHLSVMMWLVMMMLLLKGGNIVDVHGSDESGNGEGTEFHCII